MLPFSQVKPGERHEQKRPQLVSVAFWKS